MTKDTFAQGLGKDLVPGQFAERHHAMLQAASRRTELIHAELLLRIAVAHSEEGKQATLSALSADHPVVDKDDQLLDLATARTRRVAEPPTAEEIAKL